MIWSFVICFYFVYFLEKDERFEILQSLTRDLVLDEDVKLREIAENCEHFTGADFKALLYNAQLAAIHQSHNLLGLPGHGMFSIYKSFLIFLIDGDNLVH